MPADTEGIVRPPRPDTLALGDSTTAHLFSLQTRMIRGAKINLVAFSIGLVSMGLTSLGGLAWYTILGSGGFLLGVSQAAYVQTERVWIVGPDPDGWLVVRVDGSHAAWPARRSADIPETSSEPLPTAEEITARCAGIAAKRARFRFHPWRDDTALPELIKAGPWQRTVIRLQPWRAHAWSPTCAATGTVRLADGSTFEITMRHIGLDVYANAWETGSLWIAGEPVRGRKIAVGFPGYPALGVALVS